MGRHVLDSVPGVGEVSRVGPASDAPGYLIEVPHGATNKSDFDAVRERLHGPYPDDLVEFFFVNTDVGAPECATSIARGLAAGGASVVILRCLIPRTFVDCNRFVHETIGASSLTPGLPEYVSERDSPTLVRMYDDYQDLARRAYELVCGSDGLALTLHTYAPRSVGIERVDNGIVEALREAYRPGRYELWPRRPDVDIISEDTEGLSLAPPGLVAALRREYGAIGIEVAENATYRLLQQTMGHLHSVTYPGRVLCMEINRALLADPFRPFVEMRIGLDKVERMSAPIVAAFQEWRGRRSTPDPGRVDRPSG